MAKRQLRITDLWSQNSMLNSEAAQSVSTAETSQSQLITENGSTTESQKRAADADEEAEQKSKKSKRAKSNDD